MVGVSKIQMEIIESDSLKDKRKVLKSLKDRVKKRFNASIFETSFLDNRRKAELEIAVVADNRTGAEKVLQEILKFIEVDGRTEIVLKSDHFFYCNY